MFKFVSEEAYNIHFAEYQRLLSRYEFYKKAIPILKDTPPHLLNRRRFPERDDIMELYRKVYLHRIYFSSFSDKPFSHSDIVSRRYGSDAAFYRRIYEFSISSASDFVGVYIEGGELILKDGEYPAHGECVLALDLSEHVYFLDWRFRREVYLSESVRYLNLSLIDKALGILPC